MTLFQLLIKMKKYYLVDQLFKRFVHRLKPFIFVNRFKCK